MTNTEYDAIVVGGGHNGLTAAAYLARGGLRVCLLERRSILGGCCVTEEIAPGCRASTTSYMASMLRPEVIRDLGLKDHGLRMVPSDPLVQVPFADGDILGLWSDSARTLAGIARLSARDARTFASVDARLKRLARYLQPFFLEPPPNVHATGLGALGELLRAGKRFRKITGDEIGEMVSFLTGSLGDFLDRHYESDKVKTLILANNVYGKHGGPYEPGTALGLLFHLLSGGEHEEQGFCGHVIGGMGAITQAMAGACRRLGVELRTDAEVERIEVAETRVRGVRLGDGSFVAAPLVLSNADPKRTFLRMIDGAALPEGFRDAIAGIKMDGPCAKVNLVLSEEPRVASMPPHADSRQRSLFTLVPSLDFAQSCYETARRGIIPDELWVDCVVASNVDPDLCPPGRHVMTCFVQYVPYRLREGSWDDQRDALYGRVMKRVAEHAPNVPGAVVARQVLTPLDLERTYGITEGNIFHGDLSLQQLFFMRPVPGWAQYRSPISGLYLCGAGAHPGGGVTGAPGYNAARQALRDRRRGV